MAIHSFCTHCKTSSTLDAEKCPKCGIAFGRSRKYRVCVSDKRQRGKRVTRVVDNLTLAREAATAIKADLLRGDLDINQKPKKVPTLNEVWAKVLPWAMEHKKTWDDDMLHYRKHLEPRFGKKRLDAISAMDIERMKAEMRKGLNKNGRPYSPATIKHQMVLLNRLFNLAHRWGLYAGENPMKRVEVPKLDNHVTEFMEDAEVSRLLKTLETWPCRTSAAFVKFTLLTGIRRGELFKLQWDDVDFEREMVTLREPKGGKTQTIPVSAPALEVLKTLEMTSPFVFPGKNGQRRTDFKGPWKRIRKAAGLPENFRFHGLRHHFASTLVSNGVDLCVVQALLTHKDSRTTQRYCHLKPGAIKDAAMKSADLLRPKDPTLRVVNLQENQ
ncbi:MAG: site-specific integrase [Deltaproteobacteria bacterium]|nr:site-specific integrase [Deltaproteobacteria bacterium]